MPGSNIEAGLETLLGEIAKLERVRAIGLPADDLPADFDASRDVHYQALGKPRDPAAFIAGLREQHATALGRLNDALAAGTTGGVKITARRGDPWISVPHIPRQPEPANLKALKEEFARRRGIIDLLNLIKDADHVTGFTAEFTSVASRQVTDPETLRRRLLLVLFGLGTNMGIKRVADGAASASGDGGTADSEAALRRVRRLFINRDNLRGTIRRIVNETLAARDVSLWGGGTSCASDSVSTPRIPGPWSPRQRDRGVCGRGEQLPARKLGRHPPAVLPLPAGQRVSGHHHLAERDGAVAGDRHQRRRFHLDDQAPFLHPARDPGPGLAVDGVHRPAQAVHRFHAADAERAGQDLGRTRVSRDDPAGRQVVKGRALVAHSAGQDHRVPHHQLRYQRPCPAAGDDSANPAGNDLLEHRAGQRCPDSGMEHTQPHTAMLDLPQRCRAHLAVQAAHWPGVGPAGQFLDDVPEEARHSDRRRVDRTDQPTRLDDRLTGQILILQ